MSGRRIKRNPKGEAIAKMIMEQYHPESREDMHEAMKEIFGPIFETMLQGEMDEHLGYATNDHGSKKTSNRRNGYTQKNVKTRYGEVEIAVPRDRESSFEPQIIPKRTKDVSGIEDKVLSMYAGGMSQRDIAETIEEIYGFDISSETISKITDRVLDQVMPGIQSLMSDSKSNHKLTDFVSRYWHYGRILSMGEKRFTADYCKWAKKQGYRVYERLAKEILVAAQNGIPVLPNSQSTKIVVQEAVRVVHQIEISRDTILTQMQQLAKSLPEYSVVRDMPCIGDTLAPRVIAEIGDVRRFRNKHSLIAYAGIDAPPYQSGSFFATERHISKRGNSYLRKTGYEIMQCLIQHQPDDDPVYSFIQKKRSEGKSAKEAMIAGLNKFLRIYYGRVTELYNQIDIELTI